MLLEHLYAYRITMTGGRQLESDMVNYCSCVRSFNHSRVDQQFIVLREVVRLFTARPEDLPALLRGKSDMDTGQSPGGGAGEGSAAAAADDLQAQGDGATPNGGGGNKSADASSSLSTVLPNIPRSDLRRLLRMRDDCRKEKLDKLVQLS